MRVLICGGGVIGASLAYFLSRRGAQVIVIERAGIACAASGKSGGFLALDWCDGGPLQQLARRSFALHEELSGELGGTWGYRRLTTYAGVLAGTARGSDRQHGWLKQEVALTQQLGSEQTTAQVHPGEFATAMMHAAEAQGAKLREGQVTGLVREESGRVTGAEVKCEIIEGDAVVIAMGPWSTLASGGLPLPRVYGLKGHSMLFDTGMDVPPEALFLEVQDEFGALSPEVFPRADGTTYVCAISSDTPVPPDPALVLPDPGAMARLGALCSRLSPALTPSRVIARQACFRPVTQDGLPMIGEVPGAAGAYVATGHSVWGILNAPATGEAIAELITDGAAQHVDLSFFEPGRFPAIDPAEVHGALDKGQNVARQLRVI